MAVLVRRFVPLLPLPLLVALAAWGSAWIADAGGAALGAALSAVADVVRVEQRPAEDEDAAEPIVPVMALLASDANVAAVAAPKGKKTRAASSAPAGRSIFVSAETVLKLADGRVKPRGVRVAANGARPAGLKLVGVGALGVGLRDGDVLTTALGQPALSSSAVVRAILVARSQRARVLEGEFFRGQERWVLRVEQPYLDEASPGLTGLGPGPRLRAP
jgi:hypothetical protein